MNSLSPSSGMWAGHYRQHERNHPQQMRLEFADGLMRGSGDDQLGTFTIDGEFRVAEGQVRVGWIKTYRGAHSILYLGTFDGVRIEGRWDIDGYGDQFALEYVGNEPN
ncbi:MAG TPA: hypothetical protein VF384_00655 [Planctomycetota bacterium]